MLGIHDFGVFVATGVALNLTPGPDTLYILGRSIAQGRPAGIASVLGISAGALVHTLAAAMGLSALIAASATAFLAVKFVGAAYLIFLGVRMVVGRGEATVIPTTFESSGFAKVFRQGLLTNVLNPKVALFFLAFLPQFIATDSPAKFAAFLVLGSCFVVTSTLWGLCLAGGAAWIGDRLRRRPATGRVLNRGAGALFVLLGLRLATER